MLLHDASSIAYSEIQCTETFQDRLLLVMDIVWMCKNVLVSNSFTVSFYIERLYTYNLRAIWYAIWYIFLFLHLSNLFVVKYNLILGLYVNSLKIQQVVADVKFSRLERIKRISKTLMNRFMYVYIILSAG